LFGNASTETNVSDFKLNYSRVFHIMQKIAAENEDKSSDLTLLIGSGSQSPADRLKQMYSDVKALFDKTMLREKLPAPREIVSFKSQALDEELLKPKKEVNLTVFRQEPIAVPTQEQLISTANRARPSRFGAKTSIVATQRTKSRDPSKSDQLDREMIQPKHVSMATSFTPYNSN